MIASISALGTPLPRRKDSPDERRDAPPNVPSIAQYFTRLTSADYYTGSGEPPGTWFGEGSPALGLQGTVAEESLINVLAGKTPDGCRRLGRLFKRVRPTQPKEITTTSNGDKAQKKRKRRERCPGYDLTLSVPKSVSALWAVAPAHVREAIDRAIHEAACHTLAWLENSVPLARRGKWGLTHERAKLVVAMFHHSIPRNVLDPQRHVHCLVANTCQLEEGSWGSVNGRELMNWTRTLGPMFRANLGAELRRELGLELTRPVKEKRRRASQPREKGRNSAWTKKKAKEASWFEIKGVPDRLVKKWSSRRNEIEDLLRKEGLNAEEATAQARQHATLATRTPKDQMPSKADLFAQWQAQANQLGFGERQVERLLGQAKAVDTAQAYQCAWKEAIRQITDHHAHFTRRELIQEICERLQDKGMSGTEIANRIQDDLAQSKEIIKLGETEQEQRYTTKTMWNLETKLQEDVRTLQSKRGASIRPEAAERVIATDKQLTKEQADAARTLLTDESGIRSLTGVAGAGKSRTIGVVREGLERAGYRVLGGAISGAAKEELAAQARVESRTVASYLFHLDKTTYESIRDRVRHDVKQLIRAAAGKETYGPTKVKLDSKTVVIVDEAGMLDTHSLSRLVHHVEKAGATLILAGDDKQLPPIAAGGPFRWVAETVTNANLKENFRQRNAPEDRQAAADIRDGKAQKALLSYAERGRLTVGEDRHDTIRQLVTTWSKEGGVRRPQESIIFTQTRREAATVNQICQSQRQLAGEVSDRGFKVGQQRVYEGDRVLFQKPLRRYGIENGYRATVVSVQSLARNVTVRLDREPSAQARDHGVRQTVTVPMKEIGDDGLTLGYAATTHKMQGQSVDKAYVLLGGRMTNQEMAYVQATRGKQVTRLFVDAIHAGEEIKDLANAMTKSGAKDLAHDQVCSAGPTLGLELTIQQHRTG